MKTRILANRHNLAYNKRHGTDKPPLSIQTYKGVRYAHEVYIDGPSKLVYRPDKPLKCGATVWIETEGMVRRR